jgi:ABC-type uncharacterized transport system substrate-binding protein
VTSRRIFLVTFVGGIVAVPLAAEAQQAAKVARIGVPHPGAPATSKHFAAAFDQGLRALGYLQGQNIVVERRFAEAKVERMSHIAAELVRLKVDVIVTSTDPGIAAVRQQTQTIPILMANSTDPVARPVETSGCPLHLLLPEALSRTGPRRPEGSESSVTNPACNPVSIRHDGQPARGALPVA